MAFIYNLTDTWNDAATTWNGIKLAVSDTGSSATSNLLNLSVSGSSTGLFTVDKNGNLALSGSATFNGATSGTVTLQAPAVAGTTTFQLPNSNGTAGYFLTTDGSGITSWTAVGGFSGTAAGVNKNIQFNDGTALGGASSFNYDKSTGYVGIGTSAPSTKLNVYAASGSVQLLTQSAGSLSSDYALTSAGAGIYQLSLLQYGNGSSVISTSSTSLNILQASASPILFSTSSTERMRIDSAGLVGINTTTVANTQLQIGGNSPTSGNSSYIINLQQTIPAGSTTTAVGYCTTLSTAAAAFTCATFIHFNASQSTIGAGSAITNQYGFIANSNLTGATNNYGFFGNIASGTGRYNFYASGTADNYFAGNVGVGVAPTAKLNVLTTSTGDCAVFSGTGGTNYFSVGGFTSGIAYCKAFEAVVAFGNVFSGSTIFLTGNTERLRIDSTGNVLVTSAGGLGYGTGSGGAVTQLTSRTTGVTLNKTNGAITMFTAAGSATAATFTVTNSTVAATDTIVLSVKSATNLYVTSVTAVAAGSFNITFYTTGGTTSDTPVINFAVIKAVTA